MEFTIEKFSYSRLSKFSSQNTDDRLFTIQTCDWSDMLHKLEDALLIYCFLLTSTDCHWLSTDLYWLSTDSMFNSTDFLPTSTDFYWVWVSSTYTDIWLTSTDFLQAYADSLLSGTDTEFYIPDLRSQAAVMVKIRTFKLDPDLFRTTFGTFPDL